MAVDIELLPANSINNIDTNFERVETALQDAISRSGTTPNQMNADLDMNSNDLLNVKTLQVDDITIDGTDPTGILERALGAAEEAEGSAEAAAISEANAEADAISADADADRAEAAAILAESYIPAIVPGDDNKVLRVNDTEDGGEWAFVTTDSITPFSVDFLTDVDITSVPPVSGDGLVWDGSEFVPGPAGGGMFKGNLGTTGTRDDDIFRINAQTVAADVTIDANENASATGPLTIDGGVTVTVNGTLTII